jgi:hypothetical protein
LKKAGNKRKASNGERKKSNSIMRRVRESPPEPLKESLHTPPTRAASAKFLKPLHSTRASGAEALEWFLRTGRSNLFIIRIEAGS